MAPSTVWQRVPALGVTRLISWGSRYYAIAVPGASRGEELGLSTAALEGKGRRWAGSSFGPMQVAGRLLDGLR